jgi:hypothetical protein
VATSRHGGRLTKLSVIVGRGCVKWDPENLRSPTIRLILFEGPEMRMVLSPMRRPETILCERLTQRTEEMLLFWQNTIRILTMARR